LAFAAGISRQAVWKALVSRWWHGHNLEVRTIHGRGGRSGIQYQVKVSSLPPHLQERLKALQSDVEARLKLRLGDDQARLERAWKYDVIRPALAYPAGSGDRRAEIDKLDGVERLDWTGQYRKLARSTLYAWIDTYEAEGIHGLAKRVRKDKGAKRVYISRAWTKAVPFDDEIKATIEHDIKQHIRSLIKGGLGPKQTREMASAKLEEITGAYGFLVNHPTQIKSVFAIPQAFVQAENQFKAVYLRRSDRKAYEDDKPRIHRTIEGLMPMDVVVADIHHTNVRILRDDGTTATPKMIAFMDIATERVFYERILFEGRGGVRNVDVIRTFINMCMDHSWGLPKKMYFDNGSEYRFADYLEDALRLGVEMDDISKAKSIHRAMPNNPATKRVEGLFREYNQGYQRHIPGWIGDDRMNPKGKELGKLHAPYRHGFDAFCDHFRQLSAAYDNMPKSGALQGKSPNGRFREFVEDGWRATVLDPHQLLTVFTKPEQRTVTSHEISVDGRQWTSEELARYFGRKVIVHIPQFGFGFNLLKVCDPDGNEIGDVRPCKKFEYFNPRGAQESAHLNSIRNKALTELAKSAPEIDVGAALIEFGAKHLPVVPNEPKGVVSVSSGLLNSDHAIMPVMTKAKTREQLEAEEREMDEARSRLVNAAIAANQRRYDGNR
jgi:hypothetical protein